MSGDAVIHCGVGKTDPEWFENRFAANGWTGAWRNGVYGYHHYHATTHEVLGCYAGSALLQLGGPDGAVHAIAAGDVVVIPAGVAHRRVDASDDFAVVGAYPDGVTPDLQEGGGDPSIALDRPDRDPVLGEGKGFAADG